MYDDIITLSPETLAVLNQMHEELTICRCFIDLFLELAQSEERVAAWNRVAPFAFHLVQSAVADAAALGVARMTDRHRSGGHDTVSIRRLSVLVEGDGLEGERMRRILDAERDALTLAKRLRTARDKRLAHLDHSEIATIQAFDTKNFNLNDVMWGWGGGVPLPQGFRDGVP